MRLKKISGRRVCSICLFLWFWILILHLMKRFLEVNASSEHRLSCSELFQYLLLLTLLIMSTSLRSYCLSEKEVCLWEFLFRWWLLKHISLRHSCFHRMIFSLLMLSLLPWILRIMRRWRGSWSLSCFSIQHIMSKSLHWFCVETEFVLQLFVSIPAIEFFSYSCRDARFDYLCLLAC